MLHAVARGEYAKRLLGECLSEMDALLFIKAHGVTVFKIPGPPQPSAGVAERLPGRRRGGALLEGTGLPVLSPHSLRGTVCAPTAKMLEAFQPHGDESC